LMEDEDFHSQIGREELSFGGVAADAAWCSSNWEENNHIYLVANYPLLVSGLVHPSYKWINPTKIPFITEVIIHLLSGMSHQVCITKHYQAASHILWCYYEKLPASRGLSQQKIGYHWKPMVYQNVKTSWVYHILSDMIMV
jgi:hypothetical protein